MSKGWKIILSISLAVNLALGYLLCSKPALINSDSEQYVAKIDSLESELISIQERRDEVKEEIDTVYIQLKNVDKEYAKAVDRVIANSPDDDYCFFVEYLERNRARLDSINNF